MNLSHTERLLEQLAQGILLGLLDRRDRNGSAYDEVRAVRTDRTLFPEPVAVSCQAPERVLERLEFPIDGFDACGALVVQSRMEDPADKHGPELRSGFRIVQDISREAFGM